MDRELNIIELSDGTKVSILSYLTWGEKERVQKVMLNNANISITGETKVTGETIFEYERGAMQQIIKKIEKDDTEIPFSFEWLDNLSIDDGDLLWGKVSDLIEGKKKAK